MKIWPRSISSGICRIEEGQHQRADMGAVDVGVRHDDDLVIAQLVGVELVAADARAERGDQRADLFGRQHLVETRALDIQDLAAQRQHRLVFAIAALLGGAAGGVALDDEEFGLGRIALLAIGKLAGQVGDIERALAARQFARLARRFARARPLRTPWRRRSWLRPDAPRATGRASR